MRCHNCNTLLLGPTLIDDTTIRCGYCLHMLKAPHNTNFQNILKKNNGDCPLCGQFNESFKQSSSKFICLHCGRSFRVGGPAIRRGLLSKSPMPGEIVCANCGKPVDYFLMLNPTQCACLACSYPIDINLPIDIPRIVLTESGTCPVCFTQIFSFEREKNSFKCEACDSSFTILLPTKIALDSLIAFINGSYAESEGDSEPKMDDESPFSKSKVDLVYKKLLRALGRSRSYDEMYSALMVEFLALFQKRMWLLTFQDEVQNEEKTLWEVLANLIPDTLQANSDSQVLSDISDIYKSIAEAANSKGFEDIAAICYSVVQAIWRCQEGSRKPIDVSAVLSVRCPHCDQHGNVRIYQLVQSDSPVAQEIKELNIYECAICGTRMRLPISLSYCDIAHARILCWLNTSDFSLYQQTNSIPLISEYLKTFNCEPRFSLKVTDNLENFWHWYTSNLDAEPPVRIRVSSPDLGHAIGTLRQLGAKYFVERQYDAVIRIYTIAITFDPLDPMNYEGVAAARMALGQHEEALKVLKKAQSISDEEAGHFYLPAEMTKSSGEIPPEIARNIPRPKPISEEVKVKLNEAVIKELQHYLKQHPDDQNMCLFLGASFWALGKTIEAVKTWLKAITIQKDSQVAYAARLMLTGKLDNILITEYLKEQLN